MNDDELRRAYRDLRELRAAAPPSPNSKERPEPERVWAALDGNTTSEDRVDILNETLRTGGSDELALLHAMHSAAEATTAAPRRKAVSRNRWGFAAAAAVVVAVGGPVLLRNTSERTGDRDEVRYRGSDSMAPVLLAPAPAASLVTTPTFVWRSVADARSYTLEAFDNAGRTVFSLTTVDTIVTLPDSITSEQRRQVTGWWVTAALSDGRSLRSEVRLIGAGTSSP